MRNATLGLYQPGNSWLHRLPPWIKLLAMLFVGAGAVVAQRSLLAVGILLAGIVLAYFSASFSPKMLWRQIKPMWLILLFIALMHVLARNWVRAISIPAMMACLVLIAALVTLTTRTHDLIEVVIRAASPLQRFGVEPERVGMALLLGIRCVPLISGLASQVREAQIARCGAFSVSAFAVPLIVTALREADAMSEALVARGFDDD